MLLCSGASDSLHYLYVAHGQQLGGGSGIKKKKVLFYSYEEYVERTSSILSLFPIYIRFMWTYSGAIRASL